jgi:hypothetical protein
MLTEVGLGMPVLCDAAVSATLCEVATRLGKEDVARAVAQVDGGSWRSVTVGDYCLGSCGDVSSFRDVVAAMCGGVAALEEVEAGARAVVYAAGMRCGFQAV